MEYYNESFLQQLAPLIVVETPEFLSSEITEHLTAEFNKSNISKKSWDNSIIKNRLSSTKYLIKYVKTDDDIYSLMCKHKKKDKSHHSILSPFDTRSDLFPNGILSQKWFEKYLGELPFAFITILELPSDEKDDESLSARIVSLKHRYHDLNTKFVCIIVSSSPNPDMDDERINKLRQVTNLPKLTGLLYLPLFPNTLQRDSEILITTLLSNLKNAATEFYSSIESKIKQRYKKYYSCPSTEKIETMIEMTPESLETRNIIKLAMISQFTSPHDLESSVKRLELAYEHTIMFLRDIASPLYSTKSVSEHDAQLFKQNRMLLDVIAYHIVRGYFSIEEPVSALRKHQAHISNVLDLLSYDPFLKSTNNWLSIQYQWVAELMSLIPESLMVDINSKSFKKKSKNIKLIEFYGGLQFLDAYNLDIITHPGLLFLKAANLVKYPSKKKATISKLAFLEYFDDDVILPERRIRLLKQAQSAFLGASKAATSNTDIDAGDRYQNFLGYINWLIAEDYWLLSQTYQECKEYLDQAIGFYKLVSHDSVRPSASSSDIYSSPEISSFIHQKLLACYSLRNDTENILYTVLSLSFPKRSVNAQLAPAVSLVEELEEDNIVLDSRLDLPDFCEAEILLINQNSKKPEATIYDEILTQLVLKPRISTNILKQLLKEDVRSIKMFVKSVRISNSNKSQDVVLMHKDVGSSETSIFKNLGALEKNGNALEGMLDLYFDGMKPMIVHYTRPAEKAGVHSIKQIELTSVLEIECGDRKLTLDKSEKIIPDTSDKGGKLYTHHKDLYSAGSNCVASNVYDLVKTSIRIQGRSSHSIMISPLKPDLSVVMASASINTIMLGENIIIPFEITYKNPKKHIFECESIYLVSKVSIVSSEDPDLSSSITTRANWDTLKDEEALDLKDLVEQGGGTKKHNLCLSVHSSPQSRINAQSKPFNLMVELKTTVYDKKDIDDIESEGTSGEIDLDKLSDDLVSVYDTASYNFPVINQPFETNFVITPRYREGDEFDDMPNPFVLSGSPDSQEQNQSMPVATRFWVGKLTLSDNFKKFEGNAFDMLKVLSFEFSVKTKNPGLIVQPFGEPQREENGTITQMFSTRSKHGFTHRNASVNSTAFIKWQRNGGESDSSRPVNTFETEEWEIVLPLSDPRVLLASECAEDDSKTVKLKYILENPTPRIFTFTTHLFEDPEDEASIGWELENERNLIPLKQGPFPVLPMTRHVMEYYITSSSTSTESKQVALPQFRVFDVDYKISLPTLSVTDNVSIVQGKLFLNLE